MQGLRVLLDGVFNHVGTDTPLPSIPSAGDADAGAGSGHNGGSDRFATFEGHGDLIALNPTNRWSITSWTSWATGWTAAPTGGDWTQHYAGARAVLGKVLPRVRERHPTPGSSAG